MATIYTVRDERGEFVMSAPLSTIAKVFDLRSPACSRIEREAGASVSCRIFFNGRAVPIVTSGAFIDVSLS